VVDVATDQVAALRARMLDRKHFKENPARGAYLRLGLATGIVRPTFRRRETCVDEREVPPVVQIETTNYVNDTAPEFSLLFRHVNEGRRRDVVTLREKETLDRVPRHIRAYSRAA